MADLSNVINVALLPEGAALQRDNMNVCAIITSDTGFLNSAKRYETYSSIGDVATNFGTSSKAYLHAFRFFAQVPNPINASGKLVIGHWRAAAETVPATAGVLTGAQISEAVAIPQLQAISDGSFKITVDGTETTKAALDFRVATTMADIVSILDTAIADVDVVYSNQRLIATSKTTGVLSEVSLVIADAAGTFVGEILGLSAGTGAISVNGVAEVILAIETKEEAVIAVRAKIAYRGFSFGDAVTDAEAETLATWALANDIMSYDVFSGAAYLNVDVTNTVWKIKLAGQTNYRMLYRKDDDRTFATAYMARMHTVNFTAENTALTMHLKELKSIVAEDFTQGEIDKAKTVGLDIYTTFKNVPKLLTSGANGFTDDVYNLLAYIDSVQTDAFNALGTTATKIAQTNAGVNVLVDTVELTTSQFVRAGVFAPGTWTSSDRFGDVVIFNNNIEAKGYYVLAESLADQAIADRQARKSPAINVAVKNAGAVHSVSILIRFNL